MFVDKEQRGDWHGHSLSLKDLRSQKNTATTNCADTQTARKRKIGWLLAQLGENTPKVGNGMRSPPWWRFQWVDCRRLMANASRFHDLWPDLILETHDPTQSTVTPEELRERMERHRDLLGKLDVVFSMGLVRGVDFLPPTPEEIKTLKMLIEEAQISWLQCGFNIEGNPKAHLMFDGHLLAQLIKHGGLADKIEDPIEFDHLEWKKEKDRTRSAKDFKAQQKC